MNKFDFEDDIGKSYKQDGEEDQAVDEYKEFLKCAPREHLIEQVMFFDKYGLGDDMYQETK